MPDLTKSNPEWDAVRDRIAAVRDPAMRRTLMSLYENSLPDAPCPECGVTASGNEIKQLGRCVECADAEDKARARSESLQVMLKTSGMPGRWVNCLFGNTAPRDAQARVYQALMAWRWGPRGWYLYGSTGTGKTRLAACLANQAMHGWSSENIPGQRVLWLNVPQMMANLKASFSTRDMRPRELLGLAQTVPLVILDDLGAELSTDFAASEILPIVDARYSSLSPIVITSNLPMTTNRTTPEFPQTLGERLGARIADRIAECCQVAGLHGASLRPEMSRAGRVE